MYFIHVTPSSGIYGIFVVGDHIPQKLIVMNEIYLCETLKWNRHDITEMYIVDSGVKHHTPLKWKYTQM